MLPQGPARSCLSLASLSASYLLYVCCLRSFHLLPLQSRILISHLGLIADNRGMMESNGIPTAALPMAIFVLLYSMFCLLCSLLLIYLLWKFDHGLNSCEFYNIFFTTATTIVLTYQSLLDVALISFFASLGTLCSVIQQLHFVTCWRLIKNERYEVRNTILKQPPAVVSGSTLGMDRGLFWIRKFYLWLRSTEHTSSMRTDWSVNLQNTTHIASTLFLFSSGIYTLRISCMVCHNGELMSCRASTLFIGTWRLQVKTGFLREYFNAMSIASKVFAVVFPGILFGVVQVPAIATKFVPFVILCNVNRMSPCRSFLSILAMEDQLTVPKLLSHLLAALFSSHSRSTS